MPRTSRKRKASLEGEEDTAHDEVLGGMRGGYRASGRQQTSSITSDFTVPFKDKSVVCRNHGKASADLALVFTHGAGGGIDNPATKDFAEGFAEGGSRTVCFQGTMNLKNRTQSFISVVEHLREDGGNNDAIALGGRSMGARAAVLAAEETGNVTALLLVSYPLENGKGEIRDQILLDIPQGRDVLFISGSKDNMCDIDKLGTVREKMKARSWLAVVDDADHGMSMKPKAAVAAMRKATGQLAAQWLGDRDVIDHDVSLRWDNNDEQVLRLPGIPKPGQAAASDPQTEPSTAGPAGRKPRKRRKGDP